MMNKPTISKFPKPSSRKALIIVTAPIQYWNFFYSLSYYLKRIYEFKVNFIVIVDILLDSTSNVQFNF